MTPHFPLLSRRMFVVLLLIVVGPAKNATAQPLPPGTPNNPQAPNLNPLLPLGIQRGTSLELNLTGTNLADPTGLLTTFPAKITIPSDNNNGKDNTKLRVRLEVPADAPLGFHGIRLVTTRGVSSLRLFCIDDLPQVQELDTNRSVKMAQAVPVPCVIVGRADAEATDYFKISVKAGQRLSFDVLGRRLGSVFDPELTLLDGKGRELPAGYSNDAPAQQNDPRLSYTFKEAGEYFVAIRDVSYKGAPDFHYRLRIGDFPLATAALPLAAKRGDKVQVRFAGVQVNDVAPIEVTVPTEAPAPQGPFGGWRDALTVAPRGPSGLHGWPVTLAIVDHAGTEILESEPNNEPAKANRLNVPGGITARFETSSDVDHFVFATQKGKRYVVEAHTSEHHTPTEVELLVRDSKGGKLGESNPMANTTRVEFTAPGEGDVTVVARHLHDWHGPEEVYRLTVRPVTSVPQFQVSIPVDRLDLAAGGTVNMPLLVTRTGYIGPLEVNVVGTGLSGTVTIPAGAVKAPPPKGASGTLTIKAADDASAGPQIFRLQAKYTVDGVFATEWVDVRPALARNLGNLPVPPRAAWYEVAALIRPRPPFKLTAKWDMPAGEIGKAVSATVNVERLSGFEGELALTAQGIPPGITVAPVNLSAKDTVAKITLQISPKAKPGTFPITFVARGRYQNAEISGSTPPVPLAIRMIKK